MKNFSGTLFCVHGFLGHGNDWNTVIPSELSSVRVNLFSNPSSETFSDFSLSGIAEGINTKAKLASTPRVICGYSLGGRIALHSLLANPDLWSGAILISTHPGLTDPTERASRIQSDEHWSERFKNENWNELLADWNSQPVFRNGKVEPGRVSASFNRTALSDTLRNCSLGLQENLRPRLNELKIPILWLTGEFDTKFKSIGEQISLMGYSNIQHESISESGHRILFDQPRILKQIILEFLSSV